MESLKKFQAVIFQRMYSFQSGRMQSQFSFILYQIIKLFFKQCFTITIFMFPIEGIADSISFLFRITQEISIVLTISLFIFLVGYLFLGYSKITLLEMRGKYIIQMLIPWIDIFSFLIITINIQLLLINLQKNQPLIVFNLFSIIIISLIQILYNLFDFTKQPRSDNYFKKKQTPIVCFCNIIFLFYNYYLSVTYFKSNSSWTNNQIIIYGFIQTINSLIQIKQRIFLQYHLSPFAQNVQSFFYFVEVNLSLLVLTYYLFLLEIISANLIFILVIMTFLQYSALNSYIEKRNNNMYLSSAAELKNQQQALLYLDRLCELISKVQNEQQNIILISLKKKHSLTCKIVDCSCRTSQFQLGVFIRQYVRCEIQEMSEIFHNSINVLLSILYFKMVIFKYYPQILAKLAYYSSHFNLSFIQRYYKFCLSQYVIKFIKKKNNQINAVDSQHMFKLQQIRLQIENIIKGQIQIRSKTWKYLSRGLCRVTELQHNCNQSLMYISSIMRIFEENKLKFKKSKQFNLLLLFYFIKVSFLNNGKQIKQNLKQLYFGYKQDQLYSLKQFKKFIYHKRSCVIQTLIDTKTMGIVTAASRNVQEMFGFASSKIIGLSINTTMPAFMAEQHQNIMSQWAKSGTWRTIGKLKQIYCIHKDQYCFSALIYLKIYIKNNNLHFITNIFKLNDNDFLIINPNMKIEGLGQSSKRMMLNQILQNNKQFINIQQFQEGKIYRKLFLGLKNLQQQIDRYFENINLKYDEIQKKQINKKFHQNLLIICQQKYIIQFNIKKYIMGKIKFLVIILKQAKKADKYLSSNHIDKSPSYLQNQNPKQNIDFDCFQSQQSSYQKQDQNDQLIIQHNASSSLASLTQKQNYPIAKTIQKFICIVQNPNKIKDNRLSNFNILIIIILISLLVISYISYYCYGEIMLQIQGIFFADGAQSDIMQTTQISYSYIYMLRSQLLTNSTNIQFHSTLQSARLINNYVYGLRESDFASLITNVTELTKQRLFSYLQQPAIWMLNSKRIQVLTHQFLENMYYLTRKIVVELERLKSINESKINETFFSELFLNFPQMQILNEFYLDDYQNISNRQHLILNYLTIFSMILYFILSLILSIGINNYFKFRFQQLIDSFSFFSFISNQFLQKMKDYYSQLILNIVQTQKLKSMDLYQDQIFQIDTYELFHKNDAMKGNLSSKIKFINYQNYYKWIIILLIFAILNSINYLSTSQIRNFFPTSQTIIYQINQLMRSQNKLLQNYFSLRSAYSLNPQKYINQNLYNNLINTLNQTDIKFNHVANDLTSVFNNYDNNFQNNFIQVLVNNICQLSSSNLTPFQNTKCIKELSLNILDGGILISMNFFERNVRTALQDLKLQYIQQNMTKYNGDYFRQINYVQLDKMLIYMFKIFQQTQSITFNTYISAISIITKNYLQYTIGVTIFFIIVMIVWFQSIPLQKKKLSYLYGHLLLIPFAILKSNTRIANGLKQAIEYSDS